jgi:hypothetical protein
MWLSAVFWFIFLSRPAVEALLENQQSKITNQKS